MKKVLFIFGTRPEAIKLAPVINYFKRDNTKFDTMVLVTAQHREMLDQVLEAFNITPDFDLDLMSKNQSLEILTGKILNHVSKKSSLYETVIVSANDSLVELFLDVIMEVEVIHRI